jgi:FSR family fosmidomycin resistance protein-like MFS transporter
MASGGHHGLAQSLFQVGGNAGLALGPLLAAFIVMPRGQSSIAWFSAAALVGMILLATVGSWAKEYRANKTKSRALHSERHPVLTTRRAGAPGLL